MTYIYNLTDLLVFRTVKGVMGVLHALINHLGLLITLGLLQSLMVRHLTERHWSRPLLFGLLFGIVAVLCILSPVYVNGAIYDGRSIVLSLVGIFGGLWAALLASCMAALARMYVGGMGTYVGLAVIATSTIFGIVYQFFWLRGGIWTRIPVVWVFSLLVHGVMLILQFALPVEIRWNVVSQIWAPVLLLYPPTFVLLVVIFARPEENASIHAKLLQQARLMQQLLNAMPTPVTYRDAQGRYVVCNDAFCVVTGKSRETILGRQIQDLEFGDFVQEIKHYDTELFKNPGVQKFELRIPCADGVMRNVLCERSVVMGVNGNMEGIVSVMSDVSDMRRMEEQLRHAHKLEAVGRLAGGIAHDFNNMLGVILVQVEEVLDKLSADSPIIADLEEIRMAALRSSELIRQLLLFARKQEILPKRMDPVQAVRHGLHMLRRVIPESKQISFLPKENTYPIYMDEMQFQQVVTNLVINARDAIEGNGTIRIVVENVVCEEPRDGIPMTLVPGQWVRLAVQDNGCGIDPQNIERIFDPFFTTKDTGKGTGLGLATVYGIVTQASGCIQVRSAPGQGTLFEVYFRACTGDGEEEIHEEHRQTTDEVRREIAQVAQGKGHCVLVVEDEEANLRIAIRILSRAGLHVFGASSPVKATEIFHAHANEIGLLVTDVIMPEKDGVQLWKEMRELRPDLRCVLMSGYTADVIANSDLHMPGVFFLPKPFDRAALLRAVHHAMSLSGTVDNVSSESEKNTEI